METCAVAKRAVPQREHDKAVAAAPHAEKPKAQAPAPPRPEEKSGPNYGGIDLTPGRGDSGKK